MKTDFREVRKVIALTDKIILAITRSNILRPISDN
jgi:hypothetical protein